MNLSEESIAQLATRMREAQRSRVLTTVKIAEKLGINQGQVSRILRGRFKRLDGRAMQICKFLGVDAAGVAVQREEIGRRSLDAAIETVWDGTEEDALRLARLLMALAELRK